MGKLQTLGACTVLAIAGVTRAADPFTLSAETTSGAPQSVSVDASNLVDLVGNLIDSEKEFTALDNRDISGSLRYGGLGNAVLFTRNAAGTSATLTIPSTGFTKTFNASNQDELEEQIEDFFKQGGANAYAAFLTQVNERTSFGIVDGNPQATTAILANLGFYRFGFRTPADVDNPLKLPGGGELRLSGGVTETDDSDSYYAAVGFNKTFRFGDRFSIAWLNDLRYRNIEDADVYQYESTIGATIAIIRARGDGLSWHVTPALVGGFGGSWDLAAGGIIWGGQLTSSLALHLGGWTLAMGNQIGFYDGVPIEIDDFEFETDTQQTIVKNGLQLIRDLGDHSFIDVGVTYTSLLDDAFVDNYFTGLAGVGIRFSDRSGIRFGYQGDFADDFTSHGGNVLLYMGY
jgi:hypothetical protein